MVGSVLIGSIYSKKCIGMEKVINRIFKRTAEYKDPAQATTLANSLELLSSGIYTEEERFVFELLQNAVDSYDEASGGLDVKIIIDKGRFVFMHSGKPFSERDLEGLCDIGNGNKMTDAQKIGYKGIGFKSVFMHSKRVTVITEGICFRFDEKTSNSLAAEWWKECGNVKMPWQIIPIISEIPEDIDYNHYNVVTILEVSDTERLLNKVKKLLSDARFLLFLKVANLKVSLFEKYREILSLSKTQDGNILTLAKNNVPQSRWLMFTDSIMIPDDVQEDLNHDAKTPSKLKESGSVEISFAIALDEEGHIVPIKDAVVYTYLPTSFSFGFEFLVNANFITDAGRQQLIKDCEWNKFIFSQIPSYFLNWIKDIIAPNFEDWHNVLLPLTSSKDEMSDCYQNSLKQALESIPFVRTVIGTQICIREAVVDDVQLSKGLPRKVFNKWVGVQFSKEVNDKTIVDSIVGASLLSYGINTIDYNRLVGLLQNGTHYISALSIKDWAHFIQWLSLLENNKFGEFPIIPDENKVPTPALKLFFPSDYQDENSMADDAKIINNELVSLLNEDAIEWLGTIGVKEMDEFSIIENVLCEAGYITKDNCIGVMRFIFDANTKGSVLDRLSKSEKSNLRVLTSANTLEPIGDTFLDKNYGTSIQFPEAALTDVFINKKYIRPTDNPIEWQLFFRKIGANTDFEISNRHFNDDSEIYQELRSYVDYCINNETNYGYRIHRYGLFVNIYINAQLPPLMHLWNNYEWSKLIWGTVLSKPITLQRNKDYIAGHTGWNNYAKGYLKDNIDGHRYLGKYLIQYLVENKRILPGTDGQLHRVSELLSPTEINVKLAGSYLPVLYTKDKMDPSWFSYLNLRKDLELEDYLTILAKIEKDNSKDQIQDNLDRICDIYDRIADYGYDLTEGSLEYVKLHNWGKTHKILSAEKTFEFPRDLYLIPSRMSGIEYDNTVYQRRDQENDRFASLMVALGVNLIKNCKVVGLEEAICQDSIKESLIEKVEFFAALTINDGISQQKWEAAVEKMRESISLLRFYSVPSIKVIYGKQSIERAVYVSDSDLYFVGKFGLAVQEMLHGDIVKLLGLNRNISSIFLTLMRMRDFDEMIEYLKLKGYDTSYISRRRYLEQVESKVDILIQGDDSTCGGLTDEQKREALIEAKNAVLIQLEKDGYDTSDYSWDGWTCINGVRNWLGDEKPIVIHSNRSESNIRLTPTDWNQLMKPNAMLAINTPTGVGTLSLRDIIMSRENISIRFKSDNINDAHKVSRIAELFAFFRGIQLDLGSYIHPAIGSWQRFMPSEDNPGELPIIG